MYRCRAKTMHPVFPGVGCGGSAMRNRNNGVCIRNHRLQMVDIQSRILTRLRAVSAVLFSESSISSKPRSEAAGWQAARSSYHFVIALLARAISGKVTIQQVPGSGLKPFSVFPDLLPLTTRFEPSQHLRLPAALPSERNWLLPYNSYTRSLAGRQLVIEAIIILTAAAIRPNGILNYYP
jgi:hypothetical protein